jgi:hypothetical protein
MILPPNITKGWLGSTGEAPAFKPYPGSVFSVDLTHSLVPLVDAQPGWGEGLISRTSKATIRNSAGALIEVERNEPMINGGNRISEGNFEPTGPNGKRIQPSMLGPLGVGLGIWEARTNEVAPSNDYATDWGTSGGSVTITADAGSSYGFGIMSEIADALGSSGARCNRSLFGLTVSADYVYSTLVEKNDSISSMMRVIQAGPDVTAVIDLTTSTPVFGALVGVVAGSTFVEHYAGNIYRVGFTFNNDKADPTVRLMPDLNGTSKGTYFAETGLEKGSFVTPIIPTVSSSVTRAKDNLNYSPANYNDEMTVIGDFYVPADGKTDTLRAIIKFSDQGANVYMQVQIDTNGNFAVNRLNSAGGTSYYSEGGSPPAAGYHRYACTFSLTGTLCHAFLDGERVNSNPYLQDADSAPMTGIDKFVIGRIENQTSYFNGRIGKVEVVHELLSDAELAEASRL